MKKIYLLSKCRMPMVAVTLLSALLLTVSLRTYSQTVVNGGIYTNTTWTKANSPYIVTDTVVVFPGVTLTIEPGVVVKFDADMQLEIRQATLLANGTAIDSITFTSSSLTPQVSDWGSIWINLKATPTPLTSEFSYCKIEYASTGIRVSRDVTSSTNHKLTMKHCSVRWNRVGVFPEIIVSYVDSSEFAYNEGGAIYLFGLVNGCSFHHNSNVAIDVYNFAAITNCRITDNNLGVQGSALGDSVVNCYIAKNSTGVFQSTVVANCVIDSNSVVGVETSTSVTDCTFKGNERAMRLYGGTNSNLYQVTRNIVEDNKIGINITSPNPNVFCNKICNNSQYDLEYTANFGSNLFIPNNYWCTTDSATMSIQTYDGYDNVNHGLAFFMPLDTAYCSSQVSGVGEPKEANLIVFPNPAADYITIDAKDAVVLVWKLYNLNGQLLNAGKQPENRITLTGINSGMYVVEVETVEGVARYRFIKQ